jgi:hypothetical protein
MKRILKSWKPEHPDHKGWRPKSETEWQESLFRHMTQVLPEVQVA